MLLRIEKFFGKFFAKKKYAPEDQTYSSGVSIKESGPADQNQASLAKDLPVNFQIRNAETVSRDVDYAISIAENIKRLLTTYNVKIEGARILEIGPGINFGSVLYFSCLGAKASVNDRFLAPWDPNYHPAFYSALKTRIQETCKSYDVSVLEKLLVNNRYTPDVIECFPSPLEALDTIPDQYFDIVYSNAVLEHIYDPVAAFKNLARIMKPAGIGLHQVDFRDHRDFSRPLEFLTIEDEAFITEFENRNGECGNRWRPSEYDALFKQNGFIIHDFICSLKAEDEYINHFLPRLRAKKGSKYNSWGKESLRDISGCFVVEKNNTNQ